MVAPDAVEKAYRFTEMDMHRCIDMYQEKKGRPKATVMVISIQ